MKAVWSIGLCMFLLTACLREHDNMEDCRADLFFKMQAVPYVFEGREFAGYRSYYFFVEQLDCFFSTKQRLLLLIGMIMLIVASIRLFR